MGCIHVITKFPGHATVCGCLKSNQSLDKLPTSISVGAVFHMGFRH